MGGVLTSFSAPTREVSSARMAVAMAGGHMLFPVFPGLLLRKSEHLSSQVVLRYSTILSQGMFPLFKYMTLRYKLINLRGLPIMKMFERMAKEIRQSLVKMLTARN